MVVLLVGVEHVVCAIEQLSPAETATAANHLLSYQIKPATEVVVLKRNTCGCELRVQVVN